MRKSFQQDFLGLVMTVGLLTSASFAQDSTRVFQTVNRLTTATERRTNQERVPISITQALKPGQLVEISAPAGEIHIQKLTSNSYWILNTPTYSMTLYVGEKECLLVDAPAKYGEEVLSLVPEGALVVGKWNEIMPIYYLHYVEEMRADIELEKFYAEHLIRLQRWQETHDANRRPFVFLSPVPLVWDHVVELDSLAIEDGRILYVHRGNLDFD